MQCNTSTRCSSPGDRPLTCCDLDQLRSFKKNMGVPQQLLLRCPSCYYNFLYLFCYFTCDPMQADFVKVSMKLPNLLNPSDPRQVIQMVDYHVSDTYANGLYDSCKDVQMPSTNAKALDIICGKPAADCSVQDWLDFMGSTTNGQTPFTINYHIHNASTADVRPMNHSVTPCDQKYGNMSACSCQDCQATCAPLPPPPPPKVPCTLQGMDCWLFAMLMTFVVFCVLFLVVLIVSVFRNSSKFDKQRNDSVPHSEEAEGTRLQRWGLWVETSVEKLFLRWGRVCARNPVKVILVGLALGAVLSVGIVMFRVTTSPVELWSAEKSRARQEKNYFDSHFG